MDTVLPAGNSKVPPPKPSQFINGTFNPMGDGHPVEQAVLAQVMAADTTLTASIVSGAQFFKITDISVFNLLLEQDSAGSPKPVGGGTGEHWTEQSAGTSNGVTPLAASAGQYVVLNVTAESVAGLVPPGPFSGSAVFKGSAFSTTIPLFGTRLAVDPDSAIGKKWSAMGGTGFFGAVLTNEEPVPGGAAVVQTFANGVLLDMSPSANPPAGVPAVVYLSSPIYSKWLSLETQKDGNGNPVWQALGLASGDMFKTPEGGSAARFESGAIIVRKSGAAFVTYGAIYAHYLQFGDFADPAHLPSTGLPTSDEQPATPTRGRVSTFDNGDIYWTLQTGAQEIQGAILQHWTLLGGPGAFLGFPLTDETSTPNGPGRYDRFEGGVIYWTPETGAFEVHGAILEKWSQLGNERSYLGYPVSDELNVNDADFSAGRVSNFQNGSIHWTGLTGANDVPQAVTFNQSIVTPTGTALGGNVTLTLKSNGDYTAQFNMHDSGFTGYQFQVRAVFTTQTGLAFAVEHSGSVGGTSTSGSRDDNYSASGNSNSIMVHWSDVAKGTLWVTKDYSATGVAGFFEDMAGWLTNVAVGAAGAAVGVVIGLGDEIGKTFGNLGLGGVVGVLAGVVVTAFTGGVMLGIVVGVVVGAVTNALIKQRQITSAEYAFAQANAFNGSLPPMEKIRITNVSGLNGTAFSVPGIDGAYYMSLGSGYDDPTNFTNPAYPTRGEVFIHEMTHIWQMFHGSFIPGFACHAFINQVDVRLGAGDIYVYGPPTSPWNQFGLEQQAQIVNEWFAGDPTVCAPLRVPHVCAGPTDPYFHYIANNVQKGMTL